MSRIYKILCKRKEGPSWPAKVSFLKNGTGEVIHIDKTEAQKLAEQIQSYFASPYLSYTVIEFDTIKLNQEV